MKSFKDSDGDGVGDLNGIAEKLDYLKQLGVDGAILSPVLKTAVNGQLFAVLRLHFHAIIFILLDVDYEVQDFMAIDPSIGTAEDFKKLLKKAAEFDIKIIINFVSSSKLCEKFKNNEIIARFPTTQVHFTSGLSCQLIELKVSRTSTSGKNAR